MLTVWFQLKIANSLYPLILSNLERRISRRSGERTLPEIYGNDLPSASKSTKTVHGPGGRR